MPAPPGIRDPPGSFDVTAPTAPDAVYRVSRVTVPRLQAEGSRRGPNASKDKILDLPLQNRF
jgi:hypothetical protein